MPTMGRCIPCIMIGPAGGECGCGAGLVYSNDVIQELDVDEEERVNEEEKATFIDLKNDVFNNNLSTADYLLTFFEFFDCVDYIRSFPLCNDYNDDMFYFEAIVSSLCVKHALAL